MSARNQPPVEIEAARPADQASIRALLEGAHLPAEDFTAHLMNFLVARRAGQVVGAVGFEACGSDALLRSLVVAPGHRSGGVGRVLLERLDAEAERNGVETYYLLTDTAEPYFVRRGFRRIAREQAPPAIRATREFADLCPASSTCLTRAVRP